MGDDDGDGNRVNWLMMMMGDNYCARSSYFLCLTTQPNGYRYLNDHDVLHRCLVFVWRIPDQIDLPAYSILH